MFIIAPNVMIFSKGFHFFEDRVRDSGGGVGSCRRVEVRQNQRRESGLRRVGRWVGGYRRRGSRPTATSRIVAGNGASGQRVEMG